MSFTLSPFGETANSVYIWNALIETIKSNEFNDTVMTFTQFTCYLTCLSSTDPYGNPLTAH